MTHLRCFNGLWIAPVVLATGLLAATTDVRLVQAVKNSDKAAIQTLLPQHIDLSATDTDGSTALHWAARLDRVRHGGRPVHRCQPTIRRCITCAGLASRAGGARVPLPLVVGHPAVRSDLRVAPLHPSIGGDRNVASVESREGRAAEPDDGIEAPRRSFATVGTRVGRQGAWHQPQATLPRA